MRVPGVLVWPGMIDAERTSDGLFAVDGYLDLFDRGASGDTCDLSLGDDVDARRTDLVNRSLMGSEGARNWPAQR